MNISTSGKIFLAAVLALTAVACGGGDNPMMSAGDAGLDARRDGTVIGDDTQVQEDGQVQQDGQVLDDGQVIAMDSQLDGARNDVGADGDLVGGPGACPDDTASVDAIGARVFFGSTTGRGNDYNPSCGLEGGADVVHRWRAPTAGRFVIDTVGSTFDTLLEVRRGTTCPVGDAGAGDAQCNDDSNGTTSSLAVSATAGEEFLLVVDGYDADEAGEYRINITDINYDVTNFQLAAYQTVRNEATTLFCERCFAAADYTSQTLCLQSEAIGPIESGCETSSYQSSQALNDALACRQLAYTRFRSCLAGIQQSCDPTVLEECTDEEQRVLSACAAIPSTYGTAVGTCTRTSSCPGTTGTGATINGTLASGANLDARRVVACGAGDGPEAQVQWTPPAVGHWVVSTEGSAFDATLVQLSACGSLEGRCGLNDVSPTDSSSRLVVNATSTAPIALLVDSASETASGAFRLNFDSFVCGDASSGTMLSGTIAPGRSLFNTCGAGEGPEAIVRWIPPTNGRYLVTVNSGFSLETTASCEAIGAGLCTSGATSAARVVVNANTARNYTFVVDSVSASGGAYQLNFTSEFPCSAVSEPFNSGSVSGDSRNGLQYFTLTCGSSGSTSPLPTREGAYIWTAPAAGTYRVSTFGSQMDTVLGVFRAPSGNVCGSPTQLACNNNFAMSTGLGPDSGVVVADGSVRTVDSALDFTAEAGQSYIFVVEGNPRLDLDTFEYVETTGQYNLMVTAR